MQRIAEVYITDYAPPAWVFSSWLGVTDKGKRVAEALQAEPGNATDPA